MEATDTPMVLFTMAGAGWIIGFGLMMGYLRLRDWLKGRSITLRRNSNNHL